ncbi:GNAT family N-acetyltransferase [Pseudonocardia sp. HH130630-07]|uniref:GNAT family N-acetyltransferase n=1 Tax=Pseudonocardia sp. HH130630-07 TaxID=1690815 RepID=UPI000814DF7F|nr:GNAT family N-acetyltransferase [Pseudonocardia sp. HH130630-07]ANY07531.1 hypothetical protein AFB00_15910 [Pseudonocardia sp. HH130630-07]
MPLDPVEINAGAWYLRLPRCDDRVDDRPAVAAAARDPQIRRRHDLPDPAAPDFDDRVTARLTDRIDGWARGTRCAWAVAEPTTGEMLGEVTLEPDPVHGTGEIACWTLPGARGRGLARTAAGAVCRFAFGGLGLHRLTWRHAGPDVAAARVADALGFVPEGRLRAAWAADGGRVDVVLLGRLAGDPVPSLSPPRR